MTPLAKRVECFLGRGWLAGHRGGLGSVLRSYGRHSVMAGRVAVMTGLDSCGWFDAGVVAGPAVNAFQLAVGPVGERDRAEFRCQRYGFRACRDVRVRR